MSTRMSEAMMRDLGRLRHEPVGKRVRALVGDHVVVDTTRAALVWEPRRVVPSYAVPVEDVDGDLVPAASAAPDDGEAGHALDHPVLAGRPVLDPSFAFSLHTTPGEVLDLRANGDDRPGVAFRPADPDLRSHVVLDFDGLDAWYDEDERLVAHPRDPFHRMDVLRSSRHVRVESEGALLAESSGARLLYEGALLPVRAYLPREDVRVPLRPSARWSACAYKGEASYWSAEAGGRVLEDVAWSYEAPLRDAADLQGLVAFFNERVDLLLDGEPQGRPRTPWS